MLIVRECRALDERLQRRLAVTVLAGVCAFGVVGLHPGIYVALQLIERMVELAAKRAAIELVLDGLMEPLADAIGLRAPGLGPRVVDALQTEIERILVRFPVAAILATAIGQNPQQWYAVFFEELFLIIF